MSSLYILVSVYSQIRTRVDVDVDKLKRALVGLEKINQAVIPNMTVAELEGVLHLQDIARQINSQCESY